MAELILETLSSLIIALLENLLSKIIHSRKGWLILLGLAFSLWILFHRVTPVQNQLIGPQWLSKGEKEIACSLVANMSTYGNMPCYSVGEINADFSKGKIEAIRQYTHGNIVLSPNATISLGGAYIVAKVRSGADFITRPPCINHTNCLQKSLNLGQAGRIKDTLTGENFHVNGMLAIELNNHDFYIANTHLFSAEKPTFMSFAGNLVYTDYVPTRKGVDTLAFVLRLQSTSLIYP